MKLLYTDVLVSNLILNCVGYFINRDQMEFVSKKFYEIVYEKFKHETKYNHLEAEYSLLYEKGYINFTKISVEEVSEISIRNLEELLNMKRIALTNIEERTQELNLNYKYDNNIKYFNYYDIRNKNPVREEKLFYINQNVNINQSHVQVPTNIFSNSTAILNAAKWTEKLDEVFIENYKQQPDLLWQYFGSETGMVRTFPGINTEGTDTTFYDARRRNWYNQAISSAKDVTIALDLSGSASGQPFDIAKLTVKKLIETFQQNDFFNIVYHHNDRTHKLIECLDKLVQATMINKQIFKKAVDELPSPSGESNILETLDAALKYINDSQNNDGSSARCNNVLMIVSDGIEKDSRINDLFKRYSHLGVVVFNYFTGLTINFDSLEKVAHENGGESYSFPTLGSVWAGVLQYQSILNEPFVERRKGGDVIFTPLYNDFAPEGTGLGLMITMAVCVISNDTNNNGKLHGVAGIDIRLKSLQQQYPAHKFGVFSYGFLINNNGVVMIHPSIREVTESIDDIPTIYLEDLEYSSDIYTIKKNMINRKKHCENSTFTFYFPKDIQARVINLTNTYCYEGIKDTPYTSAINYPLANQYELLLTEKVPLETYYDQGISGLSESKSGIQNEIASWLFCDFPSIKQKSNPASERFYPSAKELKEYLHQKENLTNCNQMILYKLLLASSLINNHTQKYWIKLSVNITSRYIVTKDGFITMQSKINETFDRDIFSEELMQHSESLPEATLVFTTPIRSIYRRPKPTSNDVVIDIAITRKIRVSRETFRNGIIGISTQTEELSKLLMNISVQYTCEGCETFNCNDSEHFSCYLIDENAYIVSSNQGNHQVGVFLGFINGQILEELDNKSFFEKFLHNDKQKVCRDTVILYDSSSITNLPFHNSLLEVLVLYLSKIMAYLFIILNLVFENLMSAHSSVPLKVTKVISFCTKQSVIYKRSNDPYFYAGNVTYTETCQQHFSIVSINNTNLDLLLVKKDLKLGCNNYHIVSNEPMKQEEPNICQTEIKYRKGLDECFKKNPDNRSNNGAVYTASKFVLFLAVISIIFSREIEN